MELMRLVVTGAQGAGKSSFIRSASQIETSDRLPRRGRPSPQTTPTDGDDFDFGRLDYGRELSVHLYGTSGGARVDAVTETLIRRAHGCLLLVAVDRRESFADTCRLVDFIYKKANIPVLVGMTHADRPRACSKADIAIALKSFERQPRLNAIEIDPRNSESVGRTLGTFVNKIRTLQADRTDANAPRLRVPQESLALSV